MKTATAATKSMKTMAAGQFTMSSWPELMRLQPRIVLIKVNRNGSVVKRNGLLTLAPGESMIFFTLVAVCSCSRPHQSY